MEDYEVTETRIKEYYCECFEQTMYRGQYVSFQIGKFKWWTNMFHVSNNIDTIKQEIDTWIILRNRAKEDSMKPTRYHKYP